jgi:hypothetical protein
MARRFTPSASAQTVISKIITTFVIFSACLVLMALLIAFAAPYFHIGEGVQAPILATPRIETPNPMSPEPVERLIFVLLAALSPAGLVLAIKYSEGIQFKARLNILVAGLLCLVSIYPFVTSDFAGVMFFPASVAEVGKPAMLLMAAVLCGLVLSSARFTKTEHPRPLLFSLGIACLAAILLQILPYRFSTANTVTEALQWSVSYDAAIFALTQVVAGKTLLADLPSQYGLFPELIAPVFKAVGLSISSLATFFALLQLIGLLGIAAILHWYVHNPLLRLMTFLCLLVSTGLFLYLNGFTQEIYLQYYPIRFFCPAVSIVLFARYCSQPSNRRLTFLGMAAGLSIFWNLDTGIPVLVAIGASLTVKSWFKHPVRLSGLLPALSFTVAALATFAGLMMILRIKAGAPLGIQEALSAQKLFYGSGFMMLPLPQQMHPWQVVLAVYGAGAITAVSAWKRHSNHPVYDVLFCCSVLGLGLFTYYQGRSHIFCLMLVLWPALVVAAIMCDLLLRSFRRGALPVPFLLLVAPFVFFVSLGSVTLAMSSSDLIATGIRNLANASEARDATVANELEFLRATDNGRNCLILAQRQAIYHAELNTASPVPGPGMIETLLQSELDTLQANALSLPVKCIYLGVGPNSKTLAWLDEAQLLEHFVISGKNSLGTLWLLEPKVTNAMNN